MPDLSDLSDLSSEPTADPTNSRATPSRGRGSELKPVVVSGAVRLGLLPINAGLSLVTAGIVIRSVGSVSYGVVLLVGTLSQLLPFADLGVGAAVTRAVAAAHDPATDPQVAAVIRRSQRVMVASGAFITVTAGILALTGRWGPWLGISTRLGHPDLTTFLTLLLFSISLPLGIGQRMLLGTGRNHLSVATTVVAPITALIMTLVLHGLHATADAYVLVYPVGAVAAAVAALALARHATGIHPGIRGKADAKVMAIALPMFIVMLGLPIGLQSDRIIISHRLSGAALSQYGLASQLYTPGWLVLSTAAFALLPIFVKRRARGVPARRLWMWASIVFAGISASCGVVFVVAAPWVAHLVSSGHIPVGLSLRLAFAALLVVQVTSLVSSMRLNNAAELRFQALCVTAMMVANVALSWVLAGRIGVDGPVVASAITVGAFMLLPIWLRAFVTTDRVTAPGAAEHRPVRHH